MAPEQPGRSPKPKYAGKTKSKISDVATEGDLEAMVTSELKRLFGHLKITNQRTLSFKFGHARLDVDGSAAWSAKGRADILIKSGERHLAVVELKRSTLDLSSEDEDQARSYARVLDPIAPLVILTNGRETRVSNAITKARLDEVPDSSGIAQLFENLAKIATDDMNDAISTLMGDRSEIWTKAVRDVTDLEIAGRSASAEKPIARFDPAFMLERDLTPQILEELAEKKVVIVEAPPLGGKSNLLRDLVRQTSESETFASFYIDVSEGGIVRSVAYVIGDALKWDLDKEGANRWLRRLSRSTGPHLLFLVEGFDPNNSDRIDELRELTSRAFGDALRFVIVADPAGSDRLRFKPNAREKTKLGDEAAHFKLRPLSNSEFKRAEMALKARGQGFVQGAQHAIELRSPWLLGAYARAVAPTGASGRIPSVVGPDLIDIARKRYTDPRLIADFGKIAKAVMEDAQDTSRSIDLTLLGLERFVVRSEVLDRHLSEASRRRLNDYGYLSETLDKAHVPLTLIRAPELLASEISRVIASTFQQKLNQPAAVVAEWLSDLAAGLPLGAVIVAQSFYDLADLDELMPVSVLDALLARPPSRRKIPSGTVLAVRTRKFGLVNLSFGDSGLEMTVGAKTILVEDGDLGLSIDELEPWLILSYVLSWPSRAVGTASAISWDLRAMAEIGSADFVLRSAGQDPEIECIPTHDLPGGGEFACYSAGVVEPITSAILASFNRDDPNVGEFLRIARESQNKPLIWRTDLALRQVAKSGRTVRRQWAKLARGVLHQPLPPADC